MCDILSSFAPHTKASLNELSKIMGMTGKPDGIDGSRLQGCFRDGKIKEIADYCETDIVNTYRVWLRYELTGLLYEWVRNRLYKRRQTAASPDGVQIKTDPAAIDVWMRKHCEAKPGTRSVSPTPHSSSCKN